MIITILSLVLLAHIANLAVFLIWLKRLKKDGARSSSAKPLVSILVPARNEEAGILQTLNSLDHLNYPTAKLQILIGNDHSTDRTEKITREFIKDRPHFQLINIQGTLGKARFKANVLAHLAHLASGEYYFFTDADTEVNPEWLNIFLAQFSERTGIVSGITIVKGRNWIQKPQELDWLLLLTILKLYNDRKPISGFGSNMAVRRLAYWDTGGYENLDFSLIEDYALTQSIMAKGWQLQFLYHPLALNFTKAAANFSTFIEQRKRWLQGGRQSMPPLLIVALLFLIFAPILIWLAVLAPLLALGFFLTRLLFISAFLYQSGKQLERPVRLGDLLAYNLYLYPTSLVMLLFQFLPIGAVWKERNY